MAPPTVMPPNILLSTAYMPPISFFAAISQNQGIYIDCQEIYQKQSFRNRCLILNSQGLLALSIPVIQTQGKHSPIDQVRICYQSPWQKQHFRALCAAYNNSPFFFHYRDEIFDLYNRKFDKLLDLNLELISFFLKKLKLEKTIISCDGNLAIQARDLRHLIHPKKEEIYRIKTYINTFSPPENFTQRSQLSILDLLCNCGGESLDYILNLNT